MFPLRFLLQKQKRGINRIFPKKDGKVRFYVKEQLLLQTLIRHGEKVMCYVETEENTETPLTVIEYISMDLKQDELQFHNPLHRKILAEAEAHLHDSNFTAERYFLAHPDPTISKLAADMINDRYQLSKSTTSDGQR